ncbi:hypothetical protein COOONC_07128 [Cooperia oncophora]
MGGAFSEKLDTDSDRIVGKKSDCLKTHEMISGTYIDMKIWQNFRSSTEVSPQSCHRSCCYPIKMVLSQMSEKEY